MARYAPAAALLWAAVAALGLACVAYPMARRSELLWSGRQEAGAGAHILVLHTPPPPSPTHLYLVPTTSA